MNQSGKTFGCNWTDSYGMWSFAIAMWSYGAEGICAMPVRKLSMLHSKINDHIIMHLMVQQEDHRGHCSVHMSYMSNSDANLE